MSLKKQIKSLTRTTRYSTRYSTRFARAQQRSFSTSSFSPLSLSPSLWLDASDTASITESSGSVSQWSDKSGQDFHFLQANSTNQPITGTRTINGLNVIDFDGSSHYMGRPFPIPFPINSEQVGAWSVSAVIETDIVSGAPIVMALDYTFARVAQMLRQYYGVPQTFGFDTGGTVVTDGSGVTISTNVPYIATSIQGGASTNTLELFVNGSSDGPSAVVNQKYVQSTYGLALSSRRANEARDVWNGAIAEVIGFDRVISEEERMAIESYLATKWGITL